MPVTGGAGNDSYVVRNAMTLVVEGVPDLLDAVDVEADEHHPERGPIVAIIEALTLRNGHSTG